MRLLVVCVGRAKAGAERDLARRYIERAATAGRSVGLAGVEMREVDESRARRPEDRRAEEAKTIRALIAPAARVIALDERGTALGSTGFAAMIREARDLGLPAAALVIGGPDGLAPAMRDEAAFVLAFGAMTWPHQLVRIMAAEQIYRAVTILAGHPYHRP